MREQDPRRFIATIQCYLISLKTDCNVDLERQKIAGG
jgi:hypothetical protein